MEEPTSASPAPSRALRECLLCDLSFDTAEEKRQHAKSEWHVYKIRCRVAESGTIITPPSSAPIKPSTSRTRQGGKLSSRSGSPTAEEESYDEESENDTSSDEKDTIEFVAEECLFCNQTSKDLDENLSHMHQTHSLVIPFQSFLVVDLQTLIWFLHMVIFSYRECICCGKRRRTIEAVQQHMTSMGHCRFNVTEEMAGFYDMELISQHSPEGRSHPDDRTLRLPSGKLLAHRSYVEPTSKSRLREEKSLAGPSDGPSALPPAQQNNPDPQALTKRDRKEQALTTHFAQLRTGDQMSLMHLPQSQQRALLLARKKALDDVKRAERRKRGRLDKVGNKTAVHTNYYKQEVPVYMGG